jgi:hypothetical protein
VLLRLCAAESGASLSLSSLSLLWIVLLSLLCRLFLLRATPSPLSSAVHPLRSMLLLVPVLPLLRYSAYLVVLSTLRKLHYYILCMLRYYILCILLRAYVHAYILSVLTYIPTCIVVGSSTLLCC